MAHSRPYVCIVEQPINELRIRYASEGCCSHIWGASSTPGNRTYPTIKIHGCTGLVAIVASIVTLEPPYRPHPNKLVPRSGTSDGVFQTYTLVTEDNNEYQFRNLAMQCVKRRDVGEALRIREELRVDPFRTGFAHRDQLINMKGMRLAFEVVLLDETGRARQPLAPAVSAPIYHPRDVLPVRVAGACAGPARGGTLLALLCDQINPGGVVVEFTRTRQRRTDWTATVTDVRVVDNLVEFEAPPYLHQDITDPVSVTYKLKRRSDGVKSKLLRFEYYPNDRAPRPDPGADYLKKKKLKPLLLCSGNHNPGTNTFHHRIPVSSVDLPMLVDNPSTSPALEVSVHPNPYILHDHKGATTLRSPSTATFTQVMTPTSPSLTLATPPILSPSLNELQSPTSLNTTGGTSMSTNQHAVSPMDILAEFDPLLTRPTMQNAMSPFNEAIQEHPLLESMPVGATVISPPLPPAVPATTSSLLELLSPTSPVPGPTSCMSSNIQGASPIASSMQNGMISESLLFPSSVFPMARSMQDASAASSVYDSSNHSMAGWSSLTTCYRDGASPVAPVMDGASWSLQNMNQSLPQCAFATAPIPSMSPKTSVGFGDTYDFLMDSSPVTAPTHVGATVAAHTPEMMQESYEQDEESSCTYVQDEEAPRTEEMLDLLLDMMNEDSSD